MKKLLLIFSILFFTSSITKAQTTLVAGDIAIIGYNADDVAANDQFTFLLLKDITANTVIRFTDFGWCAGVDITGFQSADPCGASTGAYSDGAITWMSTTAMSCGTQVVVTCKNNLTASAGTVTGLQTQISVPTDYMSLVTGGDQIFAFQGTLASPTLITGIQMNGAWDATLSRCTFSSSGSTLPAALSSYAMAIIPEVDNAIYNCTVTNDSPTNLRTAIFNSANWTTNDITPFTLPLACTFGCSACTTPTLTLSAQTNVSCNGGSNGSATMSASGGGPFTYAWSPSGGTGATAVGLSAGNYTCVVTNSCSATASQTVSITQPTSITLNANTQTNVSCFGGSNGAASVSAATGGAGGYTYNWTPGNPTGDGTVSVTGLTAGTWTCTVTDANSCTTIRTFTITQPTAISVTAASQTNISCNGGSNGAASINTPTGGAGGYSYNWTPGNPTGDGTVSVTGLIVGTWTCTVTDANLCTAQTTFNITQPTALSVTAASQTNISCNGGSNGAASINTPTGGAGGYTYNWTPGNPTGDGTVSVTGLTAATWTCTVTDANSCTAQTTFNITQPTALSVALASQSNVTTTGGSDGAASVTASGGAGGYTYNWTPGNPTGDGTASVTGLTAGTWTCTVTDANACTSQTIVTITEPASAATALNFDGVDDYVNINYSQLTSNITHELWFKTTNPNCGLLEIGDGVLGAGGFDRDLFLSGGNVVAYLWLGGPTENISSSGTNYADGAWHHVAYVLGGAQGAQKLYVDGILKATGTGTASSFNWNTKVTIGYANPATNKFFSGNIDEVRIWNRALCQAEIQNNMNCQIATSATGLAANYHFNQGFVNSNNTTVISLTDASGNSRNGTLTSFGLTGTTSNWSGPGAVSTTCTAFVPTAVTVTSASQTNISCNGGTNGAASVNASGGSGFTYDWTPGTPSGDGTASVTGLTAGSWTCTVTNNCGGTGSFTFNITQPTALNLTAASQTNVSCNAGTNGAASVTASGGAGGNTYNWTPGNPTGDGTASVTGLTAGTWTCTVTDANSCTAQTTFTITQPTALSVTSASQTNVACNGGSNGAASINTPTSGAGSYTYNWTPGNPTGDGTVSVTGLTAGTWTCTVTDANSCTATQTFTITQPTAISVTAAAQTNVACNGGSTGAASINTPTGGAGGYTYNWTPGNPTGDGTISVTGLTAGTWTCTVTDANSCTAQTTVTITQPASAVSGTTSVTNVLCFGNATGAINLTPAGGTGAYTFNWGGGITTEDRTNLAPGGYNCTITDANGCTANISATVTQPASAVSASTSVTNVSCFGGANGAINLTASGGTGTKTFNWGGGITTEDRTGLTAGGYTCTITDANGCTANISATVTQPASAVSASTSVTNVSCFGGANGAINLTASGGTGTKTFNWGGGITTEDRTGLTAGGYTCTITDANGCTATVSATVTQPTVISSSISSQTNVLCNGGSNGAATVSASGGTGTLTYSWLPSGGSSSSVIGLTAGNYTCTITDANSCVKTQALTITQPSALVASSNATSILCNGDNSIITVSASGGTAAYTGTGTYTVTAGSYTYTVTDNNGCVATTTVSLTEPNALTGFVTNTICNNESIIVNGTTYNASNPSGTEVFTNVGPNGCDSTVTINLNVLPAFTGSVTTTICNNENIMVNGTTYNASNPTGIEVFIIVAGPNNLLCDSIVTINLTVLPAITNSQTLTLCSGQSVTVGSNTYNTSGIYTDVLTAANGCDSTVNTNLTVNPAITGSQTLTLCAGQSITVGSNTYNTTGVYIDVLAASNGCDSTVTTNLTVENTIDVTTSLSGLIITANQAGASYQWIDCDNANQPISGETNQSFTATANGNYAVVVTVNSCSETSACVNINTVDIKTIAKNTSVNVYPNPSSGVFTISGLEVNTQYEVYNLIGEKIFVGKASSDTTEINLTMQPNGIYFIKASSNKIWKIVKEQ